MTGALCADRFVRIDCDKDGYVVRIEVDQSMPLGLLVHSGERDATVRRLASRAGPKYARSGRACRFPVDAKDEALEFARLLRERLRGIAKKPISQRHVERILAISSAERNRWAKDGRLARSGMATVRPGKTTVSLWTYPPDVIEALARNPDTIAAWRAADARRDDLHGRGAAEIEHGEDA